MRSLQQLINETLTPQTGVILLDATHKDHEFAASAPFPGRMRRSRHFTRASGQCGKEQTGGNNAGTAQNSLRKHEQFLGQSREWKQPRHDTTGRNASQRVETSCPVHRNVMRKWMLGGPRRRESVGSALRERIDLKSQI